MQSSPRQWHRLSLLLLGFGLVVRLGQYLHNRSLWRDEAAIALNIVNRTYGQLLGPLDYNQAAPPGFLLLERLAVDLGGNTEYALRFWPWVAGSGSLVVFAGLAYRYTWGWVPPLAIALGATSRYWIYYSNEAKQYSGDLLVGLGLWWLLRPEVAERLGGWRMVGQGMAGAIALWVSHPSALMLAALELSRWWLAPLPDVERCQSELSHRGRWYQLGLGRLGQLRTQIQHRWFIYSLWLGSFGLIYQAHLRPTMANAALQRYWGSSYPDGWWDGLWSLDALGRFFYRPLGYEGVGEGLALLAFLWGAWRCYREQRALFSLVLSPWLVTLLAAYAHKYPVGERLILFLVPGGLLWMALGIEAAGLQAIQGWQMLQTGAIAAIGGGRRDDRRQDDRRQDDRRQDDRRWVWGVGLGKIVWASLAIVPLLLPWPRAMTHLVRGEPNVELRPVLDQLLAQRQAQDTIWVANSEPLVLTYYSQRFPYTQLRYTWSDFQDLSPLQGRSRVWLLGADAGSQEETLRTNLAGLEQQGQIQPIQVIRAEQVYLYLYDFRRSSGLSIKN